MVIRAAIALALSAVCSAGCGFAMRAVPFEATPAEWERLAGDWRGDYRIEDHDRYGLIEFRLKSAAHEAFGDVLMIPDRKTWPARVPDRGLRPSPNPASDAQLLTIRFVAAEAGAIRGSMTPYWDPDRECQARASFVGSVDGDAIAGTFTSVCEDGVRVLRGRWRVARVARLRETAASSTASASAAPAR